MLIYLSKCFVALLSLWFMQFVEIVPHSGVASLVMIVVVPIGLIVMAWRSAGNTIARAIIADAKSRSRPHRDSAAQQQ